MNKYILYLIVVIIFTGCTKNYKDFNRDPYGVTEEEINRLPQGGNQLIELQRLVLPEQENSYQMCFDLFATGYAGYASQPKFRVDYPTYNPRTGWVNYPFDDTYPKIYRAYYELVKLSKGDFDKYYLAWGTVLRAGITHWLTDTYGPLPYSKMKEGQFSVQYDSQKDLYINICEDLKKSIESLKKVDANDRQYSSFDLVYGGDMRKWVKYANSLLLRIAIRMSKAAPAEAKSYAEYAVAGGLISNNSENAKLVTSDNPVFKLSFSWGDSKVGADITEYMNAFADARREKYFTPVSGRTSGKQFFGLRFGSPNVNFDVADYSNPNVSANSPIMWISASEVAFLKAEGALNNWAMGDDAKKLYEDGIRLSFEQNGVALGNYLSNTEQRGSFSDERTPGFNSSFFSAITVNWDDAGGDKEKQLSKIITQKWIAMYPYGSHEGWAEWRRTGYPNFLPAVVNNSGGKVTTVSQVGGKDRGGMRRLPYSTSEYTNNSANIKQAVGYLGGTDNGGTNLWWAK